MVVDALPPFDLNVEAGGGLDGSSTSTVLPSRWVAQCAELEFMRSARCRGIGGACVHQLSIEAPAAASRERQRLGAAIVGGTARSTSCSGPVTYVHLMFGTPRFEKLLADASLVLFARQALARVAARSQSERARPAASGIRSNSRRRKKSQERLA